MAELTQLIDAETHPDGVPIDALWSAAYPELKRLAHGRLYARGSGDAACGTTELVNESYLRLAAAGRLKLEHRGQFFAYAARVMRSVMVDLVRERLSQRRGGDAVQVTLDTMIAEQVAAEDEVLRVDEALDQLATVEPRLARVVELRYFAGMTEAEIAELLGVTDRTVRRDWDKARLLLRTMIEVA